MGAFSSDLLVAYMAPHMAPQKFKVQESPCIAFDENFYLLTIL